MFFPLRLKQIVCLCGMGLWGWAASGAYAASSLISAKDYQEKVYASWIGQIIGNTYGLSYEFKFIDQPGPDHFPYGYGRMLDRVKEVDGAFSDDDTDIEYMYLLQMEKHGIEPSYLHLSEAWVHHVTDRVWFANRAAVTLMMAGYTPPHTGNKQYNAEWFQIDPQLVNEIWAVTAPGMVDYAAQKTQWAARITNDDFGLEPAVHYGAMYAAAFFESDVNKLIDIGSAALPKDAKFVSVVEHMKRLHQQYPDNWQAARAELAKHYYGYYDYNSHSWPVVDAVLNGGAAILALLYGQGDFQATLDYSSALGFDADNQAATLCGLLGISNGLAGIPRSLMFPLGQGKWDEPFNDRYINVSRHDLPDASLKDMANRMAKQGEAIILAKGGQIELRNGQKYYRINHHAQFEAPFELSRAPIQLAEIGRPFSFTHYMGLDRQELSFSLENGHLPKGVELNGDTVSGVPKTTGRYRFTVAAKNGDKILSQEYEIVVLSPNLAQNAQEIVTNVQFQEDDPKHNIEVIRDGRHKMGSQTFVTTQPHRQASMDFYGYRWSTPQQITSVVFNPGYVNEFAGWFTSLEVQYLDQNQQWKKVEELSITPQMIFDNNYFLKDKYVDRWLRFKPVVTEGIRIIGGAGGVTPDNPADPRLYYTTISELSVH